MKAPQVLRLSQWLPQNTYAGLGSKRVPRSSQEEGFDVGMCKETPMEPTGVVLWHLFRWSGGKSLKPQPVAAVGLVSPGEPVLRPQ